MQERNQGDQPKRSEPYQENPTSWEGGERFQVILHEETTNEGKQELSLQVFDGKEIVLIQFRESVRSSRTLFLPAEQPLPYHLNSHKLLLLYHNKKQLLPHQQLKKLIIDRLSW